MTGKFQSRFGVENNGDELDGFDKETTIAERLQKAGYVTAQFGKWHLGAGPKITSHGFKHSFAQNSQGAFLSNFRRQPSNTSITISTEKPPPPAPMTKSNKKRLPLAVMPGNGGAMPNPKTET